MCVVLPKAAREVAAFGIAKLLVGTPIAPTPLKSGSSAVINSSSAACNGPRTPDPCKTLRRTDGTTRHFSGTTRHFSGTTRHFSGTTRHFSGTMRHFSGTMRHFSGTMRHFSGTMRHFSGTMRHFSGTMRRFSGTMRRFDGRKDDFSALSSQKRCFRFPHTSPKRNKTEVRPRRKRWSTKGTKNEGEEEEVREIRERTRKGKRRSRESAHSRCPERDLPRKPLKQRPLFLPFFRVLSRISRTPLPLPPLFVVFVSFVDHFSSREERRFDVRLFIAMLHFLLL